MLDWTNETLPGSIQLAWSVLCKNSIEAGIDRARGYAHPSLRRIESHITDGPLPSDLSEKVQS